MQTVEIENRVLEEQQTAAMFARLPVDAIGPWLAEAFRDIAAYLSKYGVGPVGMPYARYHRLDDGRFEIEAGFPASTPVPGEGQVEPSELPGGTVAVAIHVGPYDAMGPTYEALASWVRDSGAEPMGDAWEVYFSDPAVEPDPSRWRTEIVQPIGR